MCIESIDKIIVIHMASASNRMQCIESNERLLGRKIDIVYTSEKPFMAKVLSASDLSIFSTNYVRNGKDMHMINARTLDCACNHYNVVKVCYQLGYETIMVMEDDVKITVSKDRLNEILQSAPDDCDIMQFHQDDGSIQLCCQSNGIECGDWLVRCGMWGMQMYILNRFGMKYILDFYETHKIPVADDPLMQMDSNINACIYKHPIISVNDYENPSTLIHQIYK